MFPVSLWGVRGLTVKWSGLGEWVVEEYNLYWVHIHLEIYLFCVVRKNTLRWEHIVKERGKANCNSPIIIQYWLLLLFPPLGLHHPSLYELKNVNLLKMHYSFHHRFLYCFYGSPSYIVFCFHIYYTDKVQWSPFISLRKHSLFKMPPNFYSNHN